MSDDNSGFQVAGVGGVCAGSDESFPGVEFVEELVIQGGMSRGFRKKKGVGDSGGGVPPMIVNSRGSSSGMGSAGGSVAGSAVGGSAAGGGVVGGQGFSAVGGSGGVVVPGVNPNAQGVSGLAAVEAARVSGSPGGGVVAGVPVFPSGFGYQSGGLVAAGGVSDGVDVDGGGVSDVFGSGSGVAGFGWDAVVDRSHYASLWAQTPEWEAAVGRGIAVVQPVGGGFGGLSDADSIDGFDVAASPSLTPTPVSSAGLSAPTLGAVSGVDSGSYSSSGYHATSDVQVSVDSIKDSAHRWRSWSGQLEDINKMISDVRLDWEHFGFVSDLYSDYKSMGYSSDDWTSVGSDSFANISGNLKTTSSGYTATEDSAVAGANDVEGLVW